MTAIQQFFTRNVDSFALGLFRSVFGAFMLIEMIFYLQTGFYKGMVITPYFNFGYDGFGFIQPLGETPMNAMHFIMGLAAVCIMIGYYSRIALGVFFVCFTYFLLCCRGMFNNHFYLFSLLAFILMFTNCDKSFSIQAKNKLKEKIVPIWQYNIIRAQLVIVYFFGGIAKLNHDWLVAKQPMKSLLNFLSPEGFLSSDFSVAFFTYGGLVFDLTIGFLLLFKRTRVFAILGVIFFNFSNAIIFDDIGIFPFLMLAATIIFFDPEGKVIEKIKAFFVNSRTRKVPSQSPEYATVSNVTMAGLGVYLLFQILFPLRHHVLTDNVIWTGISRNFSWHMKVQNRVNEQMEFVMVDSDTGKSETLPEEAVNRYLNNLQMKHMNETPSMVWQFANWLEPQIKQLVKQNKLPVPKDYAVYAKVKTSFNGREPQYIVDPTVDLTQVEYHPLKKNDWILPVENP